jgi:hypothetical protein
MIQYEVELTVANPTTSEFIAFDLALEANRELSASELRDFAMALWLEEPLPGYEDFVPFMIRL